MPLAFPLAPKSVPVWMATFLVTWFPGPRSRSARGGARTSAGRTWRSTRSSVHVSHAPPALELPGQRHTAATRVRKPVLSKQERSWLFKHLPLCVRRKRPAYSGRREPRGRGAHTLPCTRGAGTGVQTPTQPRVQCSPKARGVWPAAGSAGGLTGVARLALKPRLLDSEQRRLDEQKQKA